MSIENVREYFDSLGMKDRVLEFSVSSATVQLAAEALGCAPERIAKSMAFITAEGPILVIAAGDAKVDNQKFKAMFHTKAKMIAPDMLPELIGHPMGGVCPFAIKENVKVWLDASLKRFDIVYPACGSANSAIALSLPELERYSSSEGWCDVCKLPQD